jgi:hypothetical protein
MNEGKGSVTLLDSQDNPKDIDVCVVGTYYHTITIVDLRTM